MQYGKVVSAEVMFNRETNKSRGFGFVIFESEASVELVLQDKNHVIDGKSVEVKRAVPRTDVPPPRSVSSRGGSFSGPSGPGSVGSLDDLSISTTPPVSLSGSVPSTSGLAAAMGSEAKPDNVGFRQPHAQRHAGRLRSGCAVRRSGLAEDCELECHAPVFFSDVSPTSLQ